MRAGLLFRNISVCGGKELVAISIIECLRRLGFRTILVCGKKVDETSIKRDFGVHIHVDKELVVPIWTRNIQTYFEFVLPSIAKPFCDFLINPFTSDILPWVDVTYVHYPKPLLVIKKTNRHEFWNYYYKLYQSLERTLGFRASHKLILANSFFTADAVKKVFGINPNVIYPPVNLKNLLNLKSNVRKKNLVLTISRFSSEKSLQQIPRIARRISANFIILGSLYSQTSYRRISSLVKKYGVQDKVILVTNAPWSMKMELLQKAKVYFHTMPFEHFGISIVEGMAAGCIPVVHDSGGPKEFVPSKWRYTDEEGAVQKIQQALHSWSPSIAKDMKIMAYRFREERFQNEFSKALRSYLTRRPEI